MKPLFAFAVVFLVTTLATSYSSAQTTNVIYVNGIQNTLEDAAETNATIRSVLNASANHTGTARKAFSVTAIWNPIGWYGTSDGSDLAQDKMELFLLKTAEEMYGADFRRILAPHNQSRTVDSAAAARVAAYLDDMTPGSNSLETRGSISDGNMARTQTAIQQLIARVQRLQSAVIVAHSQGNLLANLAYARLAAIQGTNVYRSVRVVNVANTSEFSVSGLSMTHAGDAALFSAATAATLADQSLETMPSRGRNWTRTTSSCAANGACNFTIAAATLARPTSNIPNQSAVDETLDHSIVETYLSTATVPVSNDQGVSFSTTATRFVDRFEDFVYAAAASLSLSQASIPVTVQPGPVTGKDIWTTSVFSFTGAGGGPGGGLDDETLRVGGWGDEYRSLIQFDLTDPSLPRQPFSVGLRLFTYGTQGDGPTPMTIHRISAPWDWRSSGTGIDRLRLWWADQPSAVLLGSTSLRPPTLPAPTPSAFYDIDITDLYLSWIAVPASNFGLELRPTLTSNRWSLFYSSNYAADSSKRPQLVIVDVIAAPPTATASLTASRGFTCGVTNVGVTDAGGRNVGGAKCWGFGGSGALGNGSNQNSLTPAAVVGLSAGVTALAAGTSHTCAITNTGGVKCWGIGPSGEIGDGTGRPSLEPVGVVGLGSGASAIAAGFAHSCAVTSAGGVRCWGGNSNGQLGEGAQLVNRLAPVNVAGLSSGVSAVSAGAFFTCALTSVGGVKCWGINDSGQLGDGTSTERLTPVDVSGLTSGVIAITAGSSHACALTTAGGVKCWGRNSLGQLGDGTQSNRPTSVDVLGLGSGATALSAGDGHTCVVTNSATVKCWGGGPLGDGTQATRLAPVDVFGLTSITAVAAGEFHTCATTNAGAVSCWGSNRSGQLGDGTTIDRLIPAVVVGF